MHGVRPSACNDCNSSLPPPSKVVCCTSSPPTSVQGSTHIYNSTVFNWGIEFILSNIILTCFSPFISIGMKTMRSLKTAYGARYIIVMSWNWRSKSSSFIIFFFSFFKLISDRFFSWIISNLLLGLSYVTP